MSDQLEVKLKITYPDIALAIEDIKLYTRWQGLDAKIRWEATDYHTAQYIELQRSTTGAANSFVPIFSSHEPSLYTEFIDKAIKPGVNYYRLKTIDIKNETSLSKIEKLVFDKVSFATVLPNPANDYLTINTYHLNKSEISKAIIFDAIGKMVGQTTLYGEGFIAQKYDIQQLPIGLYFVVISNEKEIKTYKILKK